MGGAGQRLWSAEALEEWAAANPEPGPSYKRPDLPIEGGLIRAPRKALETWADLYADRRVDHTAVVAPWIDGADELRLGVGVARMTPETHSILKLACMQASEMNHPTFYYPDHVLLALLHPDAPGAARAVLESLGVTFEAAKGAAIANGADPYEPREEEVEVPSGLALLESANLEAVELRDEQVSSEHVLIALASETAAANPHYPLRWLFDLRADVIRPRVLAVTEGITPLPDLPNRVLERRPRAVTAPGFALGESPAGHDPWRRRPWSSRVFNDMKGHSFRHGSAVRQYYVDRDGHTVLTSDGQLVHQLLDEDGLYVLDDEGKYILTPIKAPAGATI